MLLQECPYSLQGYICCVLVIEPVDTRGDTRESHGLKVVVHKDFQTVLVSGL